MAGLVLFVISLWNRSRGRRIEKHFLVTDKKALFVYVQIDYTSCGSPQEGLEHWDE
jgi:hypothetical protein